MFWMLDANKMRHDMKFKMFAMLLVVTGHYIITEAKKFVMDGIIHRNFLLGEQINNCQT